MVLFAQSEYLFVGNGDLTIDASLSLARSELENSFGLGLEPGSLEASCLLGGAGCFVIDKVELWAVVS
jgi:hypothetical protein